MKAKYDCSPSTRRAPAGNRWRSFDSGLHLRRDRRHHDRDRRHAGGRRLPSTRTASAPSFAAASPMSARPAPRHGHFHARTRCRSASARAISLSHNPNVTLMRNHGRRERGDRAVDRRAPQPHGRAGCVSSCPKGGVRSSMRRAKRSTIPRPMPHSSWHSKGGAADAVAALDPAPSNINDPQFSDALG